MKRILVADKIAEAGLELMRAGDFRGVELIPRAYHFCNQSKPDETNQLILKFLRSLDDANRSSADSTD